MVNTYQIYLISDSTGETLERIFLALKAQFKNIEYKIHSYSFTRTENQILKILEDAQTNNNSIILYTIVDNNLAKYLANTSGDKKIPCFGVLGNLILNFSKILNQKASHEPSGQHILNEEYYNRIEALSFSKLSLTMSSSMFEGLTSQAILFFSKISFLTLLLDAKIMLFGIVRIYFVYFNDRCSCFFYRFSSNINYRPLVFLKSFFCL